MEVLDGVYIAADNNKEVTVLIGLDLSAWFDTVDHKILLEHLQIEFEVDGTPLTWLRSYLDGRTQYVKIGQYQSTAIQLKVNVHRGSVLGPSCSPSIPVASPVADVIASHGVQYHQYADDTQRHLAMRADNTSAGLSVLAACPADIRQWYVAERPAAQPRREATAVPTTAVPIKSVYGGSGWFGS